MEDSMCSDTVWRIRIADLETYIPVGIHPREKNPQRVLVDAMIECSYPAWPQTIEDCFNYEIVHQLVTIEWPKKPHTDLLETRVAELLEHIFRSDARVQRARINVTKPDIFLDAEKVGVEAEWSRADFERFRRG
jgi:dihydroneopterin aldolase